ncbi:MAG: nucleoside triphosphate pyrophosphohydrolase [Bacteroidia bacterium]|nr:nucleoside triphosphate pyrophosphohydrolase [Bacteroidia bacterium]
MEKYLASFERLVNIMDELREKCPWDRKQTIESLRHLTIEETYELSEAIIDGDMQKIRNELGDLLLHIVFYSRIGKEEKGFTLQEVIDGLSEKLIKRHPHIYGDVVANTAEEVKHNWEKIKLSEKDKEGNAVNKTVLEGVPKSLPALIKSWRIQEKARGAGFDWEQPEQVLKKVKEELNELQEELLKEKNNSRIEDEFGDLLFSLINYARFVHVNPEDALEKTNRKFIKRFNYMEEKVRSSGKHLSDLKLEQMDVYWNEAKAKGL